ncbi:MAG: hypothetical protein WA830_05395, partial [Candidatus Sulfotelmatobacter sp.]
DSSGFAGDPAGPDNEMIHYHAGYLTEDSDRIVIDPESGGSFSQAGCGGFGMGQFSGSPAMSLPAMRRHTEWETKKGAGRVPAPE